MKKKLYEMNVEELKHKKTQWLIVSIAEFIVGVLFIAIGLYNYLTLLPILGSYFVTIGVGNEIIAYIIGNSMEHLDILIKMELDKNGE